MMIGIESEMALASDRARYEPENWTGEHWCEVFEWDGKIS